MRHSGKGSLHALLENEDGNFLSTISTEEVHRCLFFSF